MDLLLIRHGQAVEATPGLDDAGRWLTKKGRKATRKVARWLAKSDKRRPGTIWTSPLVRAAQTAEILAAEAGHRGEVRACAQLAPGHDPGELLRLLGELAGDGAPIESGEIPKRPARPIALVGHEPSLSLIAHALLGDVGFEGLKKSGVLALSWDPASAGEGPSGKLWFVLDPTAMKSRKRLHARADDAPPTVSSG